jgi:glyoxylate carboligase
MNTAYIKNGRIVVVNRKVEFSDDTLFVYSSFPINPNSVVVIDGKLEIVSDRPSSLHYYDAEQKQWVIDDKAFIESVRMKRDILLRNTDWVELPSNVNRWTEEINKAWAGYRQALRDITKQSGEIVWPIQPN